MKIRNKEKNGKNSEEKKLPYLQLSKGNYI